MTMTIVTKMVIPIKMMMMMTAAMLLMMTTSLMSSIASELLYHLVPFELLLSHQASLSLDKNVIIQITEM